eukprot:scaffold6532_cov116-Isochrysis_galbana.AAC.12
MHGQQTRRPLLFWVRARLFLAHGAGGTGAGRLFATHRAGGERRGGVGAHVSGRRRSRCQTEDHFAWQPVLLGGGGDAPVGSGCLRGVGERALSVACSPVCVCCDVWCVRL